MYNYLVARTRSLHRKIARLERELYGKDFALDTLEEKVKELETQLAHSVPMTPFPTQPVQPINWPAAQFPQQHLYPNTYPGVMNVLCIEKNWPYAQYADHNWSAPNTGGMLTCTRCGGAAMSFPNSYSNITWTGTGTTTPIAGTGSVTFPAGIGGNFTIKSGPGGSNSAGINIQQGQPFIPHDNK